MFCIDFILFDGIGGRMIQRVGWKVIVSHDSITHKIWLKWLFMERFAAAYVYGNKQIVSRSRMVLALDCVFSCFCFEMHSDSLHNMIINSWGRLRRSLFNSIYIDLVLEMKPESYFSCFLQILFGETLGFVRWQDNLSSEEVKFKCPVIQWIGAIVNKSIKLLLIRSKKIRLAWFVVVSIFLLRSFLRTWTPKISICHSYTYPRN